MQTPKINWPQTHSLQSVHTQANRVVVPNKSGVQKPHTVRDSALAKIQAIVDEEDHYFATLAGYSASNPVHHAGQSMGSLPSASSLHSTSSVSSVGSSQEGSR